MLQNKEYYAPVLEEEEEFVDEKGQAPQGETEAPASEEQSTGAHEVSPPSTE